ncbi:chromosome segregation ATPase [Alkalibacillus filiformis]|uniref:Chromosome segregation ATPase n=1 Tax=Alkalibacillus filiformis TaxID=200990 RepID=A0ABU0DWE8_9BACI|nr:hypothetical protein [Alkalibacillus filiformis]MDQ0352480.1 chromosome segregation ATPase [Alkalibacillus filiformis]
MLKKDVQTLVNKVFEKQQRIEQLISEEQSNKVVIDQAVSDLTSQLVDAKIEDDQEQVQQLEKELKEKRHEAENIAGTIEGYKKKLDQTTLTDQEKEEIRAAAKRSRDERLAKNKKITDKVKAKEDKINELQQEIDQLKRTIDDPARGQAPEERAVKQIIHRIEPREIEYYGKDSYVRNWIDGQQDHLLEQYIAKEVRQPTVKEVEDKGFTTGLNKEATEKKTIGFMGMNKREDVIQEFKKRNPDLEVVGTGEASQVNGGNLLVEIRYRKKGVGA